MSYCEKSALTFENSNIISTVLVGDDDHTAMLLRATEEHEDEFIDNYSGMVRTCQRHADVQEAEEGAADGFLVALILSNAHGYNIDKFYRLWNTYAGKCTYTANARWINKGRQGADGEPLTDAERDNVGYDPTSDLLFDLDVKYNAALLAEKTAHMTGREKDIVQAIATGESRESICKRLQISASNYLNVVKRATAKL